MLRITVAARCGVTHLAHLDTFGPGFLCFKGTPISRTTEIEGTGSLSPTKAGNATQHCGRRNRSDASATICVSLG